MTKARARAGRLNGRYGGRRSATGDRRYYAIEHRTGAPIILHVFRDPDARGAWLQESGEGWRCMRRRIRASHAEPQRYRRRIQAGRECPDVVVHE